MTYFFHLADGADIDELDRQIVERLQHDGRETNRSLAAALGASEAKIAARLRRMESADLVRVVALTDIEHLGYEYFALVMITVSGRPVSDVAHDVAGVQQTITVTIHSGRFDIICAVLARDRTELSAVVGESLPSIVGVSTVRCELAADVLRYRSELAVLSTTPPRLQFPEPELPDDILDELDLRIIEALQHDARSSNRSIAVALDVSEGTIRKRLRRMEEDHLIRIRAVSHFATFDLSAHAFIGVHVHDGRISEVAASLKSVPGTEALIRTIGEFDFVMSVIKPDREALADTVLNQVQRFPGVHATEVFENLAMIKHVYTWVRIIPEESSD